MKNCTLFLLGCLVSGFLLAQSPLNRVVSLHIAQQRLDQSLEILSNAGNFYFSYNSGIVRRDSLVSFTARNQPVREVLTQLFDNSFEFIESGNYIIIRKAPIRVTMVTKKAMVQDRFYAVDGYVYDERSGTGIEQATVYEKKQLTSALTNDEGRFRIRLKSSKASTAELTFSKTFYEDATILIEPRHNQELTITLKPVDYSDGAVVVSPDDYLLHATIPVPPDTLIASRPTDTLPAKVERTGMGRFLLSSKQKMQSLNLGRFFTTRPFQFSLVPGIGSHGKMGAQVINHFSLNAVGGYTAGTRGVEIGGVFNIDKKNVSFFQVAGVFNTVGGRVNGFQVAGVNNTVLDSVSGFQVAGVNNMVKGPFRGFQVGGVYNHVTDSLYGMQVGGVANFVRKTVNGLQVAGVLNFANRAVNGVQISGVFNYTKKLRGVQIGLINIADSSDGYSIGLINVVVNGYHKLSYSVNELQDVHLGIKTGNRKLYSILNAGLRTGDSSKVYSFGYGIGSEWTLNHRQTLLLNPELHFEYLYLGSWAKTNLLNKIKLLAGIRLHRLFTISAGPTFNIYYTNQTEHIDGYRKPVPPPGYPIVSFGSRVKGWLGWNVELSIF